MVKKKITAACVVFLMVASIAPSLAFAGLGAPSKPGEAKTETAVEAVAEAQKGDAWTIESDCAVCHPSECGIAQESNTSSMATPAGSGFGAPKRMTEEAPKMEAAQEGDNETVEVEADKSTMAGEESKTLLIDRHEALGMECLTCHDETDMETVHDGVTVDESCLPKRKMTQLFSTKVDTTLCTSCHPIENLVEKSAECTILTDGKGTVVNPHEIPSNDSHDTNVGCNNCHKMHSEQTAEQRALKVCVKCHHETIWECGTCHVV